ncbi:MAG: FAD-binding protein [Alphaproteobacteria bacterium]|nr:FAD-binding protein [Alphaproteobacteria bacterium]
MSGAVAPQDEAGVAAAVAEAFAAGAPLEIMGAGSKRGLLRPVQAARALTTRALTGITLYSPHELVISARAGTPLAEIEAAVAEHGQQIIAEPPDLGPLLGSEAARTLGQTLGGVVATNLSGPRRVAWGAMRDHVLGVRAVNGRGEVLHSGGRVLKNVTGLDLCKLLSGSHGTLAVITEITLKVLPAPPATGTVVLDGLSAEQGVAALAAALGSPYGVSAAAYLPSGAVGQLAGLAASATLARIEDIASSVTYRTTRLAETLEAFGRPRILDDATSRALWRSVRDAVPLRNGNGNAALWRVSVRPSAGPAVAQAVSAAFDARWFLDWGGGLVWIAGPATEAAHTAVVAAAQAGGGTWMLLRAPDGLRAAATVIPEEPAALARITRAVKAALDPKGILNPGRMYVGV